ncbi:hypothetical protein D3C78_1755180 [compost metagenome]
MHRRLYGQAFKIFNLLSQPVHGQWQRAETQRMRPLCIDHTVGFNHRIIGQALNGTVIASIHHQHLAAVIVNGADQFDRHLRIEGTATKAQLFRFFIQCRVGIQGK